MAKGVIRGTVWGLVLGGAGVVSASLVAPQPAGNTPPERPLLEVPETAAVATPDATTPEPEISIDETDVAAAPQVATPLQEITSPVADSTPLEVPQTPDIGVTLDLPEAPDVPELALTNEEPVLPNPQTLAPQVPENEGNLVIETVPSEPVEVTPDPQEVLVVETPQPVAPDVAEPQEPADVETPDPVATDVAEAEDASAADPVEATEAEVITPSASDVAEVAEVPSEEAQVAEPVEEIAMAEVAEEAPQPPAETVPDVAAELPELAPAETPQTTTPDVVEALPEPPEDDVEVVENTPENDSALAPEAPKAPVVVSIIDAPATALPQGDSGVKINRVGASEPEADPVETPTPAPENLDGPALEIYASEFTNPEGKPLMALVLLDDPSFVEAPRALAEVPFSVTVLIDPASAGAADRMAAYRAEGIEVGTALTLPEGATPSDVEVALEASFAALPQSVVLADMGTTSRAATGQILAALSEGGRGFVSLSSGLSSGLRAADAAGVPAVEIFRDLDGDGQDARVIRRFLDQAAFRARQNSGVVVMGRMRADTLSALILWGTANRAGQVSMAPVSALMTEDNAAR